MADDLRAIAGAFDERAAHYSASEWHRAHAERSVVLASLDAGQRVLDAGAGTGFATLAIAPTVGPARRPVRVRMDVANG